MDDFMDFEESTKSQTKQQTAAPIVDEIQGVSFIPFGKKVSKYIYPKFKAQGNQKVRVGFFTTEVFVLETHYHEGIGSYLCFKGDCCVADGQPKTRYCIPVIVYKNTDAKGKILSEDIEIQILALGYDKYNALIDLHEEYPITEHDYMISCTDEKYQKYDFMPSKSEGAWKKMAGARELLIGWKQNKNRAYECIAKSMPKEQVLAQLADSVDDNANEVLSTGDVVDMDDAFGK